MKSKVDNADDLLTVSVDLSKLIDVVKNEVFLMCIMNWVKS